MVVIVGLHNVSVHMCGVVCVSSRLHRNYRVLCLKVLHTRVGSPQQRCRSVISLSWMLVDKTRENATMVARGLPIQRHGGGLHVTPFTNK